MRTRRRSRCCIVRSFCGPERERERETECGGGGGGGGGGYPRCSGNQENGMRVRVLVFFFF
ncbi:hypothetical protein RHMOL_Rhmol01G0256600 [Rhododendron molle]|uniref:Uncharacterized protein n=1 Tax=Rhododendron molle TaxID=49168 RepID=A0ACC0Q5W3_RHOML|nr:hypothetical protein RHMOL_Rhmol01G0256600 [Rhododendron molle]